MDDTSCPKLDSTVSELKQEVQHQREGFRKVGEKTFVRVKIRENAGKVKNEGLPDDFWCWRKYGQKSIKGSPYTGGYYSCSTSKGCSAKKQVERFRTDASMLIINYTSSHNHPGPNLHGNNHPHKEAENQASEEENTTSPEEEAKEPEDEEKQIQPSTTISDEDASEGRSFHNLQSPMNQCSEDIMVSQKKPFHREHRRNSRYVGSSVG